MQSTVCNTSLFIPGIHLYNLDIHCSFLNVFNLIKINMEYYQTYETYSTHTNPA